VYRVNRDEFSVVHNICSSVECVMASTLSPQQNEQVIAHFKKMTAEKQQLQQKVCFGT
jgi:hypothetical protein